MKFWISKFSIIELIYNILRSYIFIFRIIFLKGKFSNKRCFILGNGPSLKEMDLSKLNNEYTFVVSRGCKAKTLGLEHATFFGISDPNSYRDYLDDIDCSYADFFFVSKLVKWKKSVKNLYTYRENKNSKMFDGFFQLKILQGVSWSGSVIGGMLQIAVYLGFTDIYLIGVDNDFKVDNLHFYESTSFEQTRGDVDGIAEGVNASLGFAHDFLKKRGISLVNAGDGGSLDSVPRCDFNDLF